MILAYLAHVLSSIIDRFRYVLVAQSLESVDRFLCFLGCSEFWGVLIGVWTRDVLGVLAGVYFFLAEDLLMGAYMRVDILDGVGSIGLQWAVEQCDAV